MTTTKIALPKAKMESIFNLALLSSGSKTIHDKAELFVKDDNLYINDNQIVHVLSYAEFERGYGFTELSVPEDIPIVVTSTLLEAMKSFDCQDVTLTQNNGKIKIEGGKWTYEENSQVPLNNKFDFDVVSVQEPNVNGLIPSNVKDTIQSYFVTEKSELTKLPQVASYKFDIKDGKVFAEMEQLGVMTAELDCSQASGKDIEASLFGAEFQHVLSNFDEGEIHVNISNDFVIFSQDNNEKKIMIGQAMQIKGSLKV